MKNENYKRYRVIGHDRGNVCRKCEKAFFCNDCLLCENCEFSTYDTGERMPSPVQAPN